ncbi:MAG TPA: branched-chain amino acid ABC transporter permease [Streptosporangiaceae bacterium]|nr:branched-chain amino acid ABC transporter permease [Streptosporangiaceae bacterium]
MTQGTPAWARPWLQPAGIAALAAAAGVFPLVFTNPLVTEVGVYTLIFVAAAAGWNIFSGYSGYISLGHAVFFGSGAYFVGIAAKDWHLSGSGVFALLPLAGLLAAVIAVPFGLVALRVRRHTFVVITIAIFFIFQLMAFNLSVTGPSAGVLAPNVNWQAATFNNPFYYVALAIAAVTIALSWLIRRSRFGLQLLAIRDDEDRARSLGVRAMRVKLAAFVISAVPMGMAGGLWMYFIGQVLPQYGFDPAFDLVVALMAFLGGLGTISGPVLGAILLEPLQQYLTLQFSVGYLYLIIYGVLFLAVIILMPRGIIPTVAERLTWLRTRSGRRGAAAGTDPDAGEGGGLGGGAGTPAGAGAAAGEPG